MAKKFKVTVFKAPKRKVKPTVVAAPARATKPAPVPVKAERKGFKVKEVDSVKIKKPADKPAVLTIIEQRPVPRELPLNPTQLKWKTPDGALILTALSFLGHLFTTSKDKIAGFDKFTYATKLEALGVPGGQTGMRDFTQEHLDEVIKKVWHIYSKGGKPEKVSQSVYNLIFYPGFRGGFAYPDYGNQNVSVKKS